jgi:hypothetical protein
MGDYAFSTYPQADARRSFFSFSMFYFVQA